MSFFGFGVLFLGWFMDIQSVVDTFIALCGGRQLLQYLPRKVALGVLPVDTTRVTTVHGFGLRSSI